MWKVKSIDLDCSASFASEVYNIVLIQDTTNAISELKKTSKDIRALYDIVSKYLASHSGNSLVLAPLPTMTSGPAGNGGGGLTTLSQRDRMQYLCETFPQGSAAFINQTLLNVTAADDISKDIRQFFSPIFDLDSPAVQVCMIFLTLVDCRTYARPCREEKWRPS